MREQMMGWKDQGIGEEFFFIGKLLGISLIQGVPYGGTLDINMCVALTKYPVTLQFIKEIDAELYRSLTYIK